ncbi:histidine--tRNA ligase [Candidatus Woesebacteria bacterium]|nr:histidine--tRNA ligase [Candidatus Woesebacteria bacterium]
MQKQNLQTLKGFRDFLPAEVYKRQWVKDIMVKTAEAWGYEPIETPTLESYSVFKGEIGEDEKLFYKFTDNGGREVMLRYDQTVPTCRYVAANQNNLTFPFRRYQTQSVFRAENTQRGRYREFTQFDLDIFGVSSPSADAEVIAVNLDTLLRIGFKKPMIIFNNRDLMKDIPYDAIVAIDKLKKIGRDGVIADMISKGISESDANKYFDAVANIKPDETINTIIAYLEKSGFGKEFYRFEPTLARSFSYSQGPIWEIVIEDYTVGSVGGGERYDGMMERLTGLKMPATGMAYGFDRTVEAADQLGLIPAQVTKTKVLVTIFSPSLQGDSLKVAAQLRDAGINTELYPSPDDKLDKQFKYADKKTIPYAIVIGEEEVKNNTVTLKNMVERSQQTLSIDEVLTILR